MEYRFLLLGGAVGFEVLWAVMLELGGFTRLVPGVAMAIAYVLSLVCLQLACRHFDLSLAYAVWTGSGASLVALIGVLVFDEPLGLTRSVGFLLVILGSVVLLGTA